MVQEPQLRIALSELVRDAARPLTLSVPTCVSLREIVVFVER